MITDLRLQHFRSYKDASFELSQGVNIVVGPNASGKTNLLEAVLVLARGSSYRVKDTELVSFNQPWARIDADLENGGTRTVKIELDPVPKKTYEISGKPYKRLSLATSLPVVLFEPNHLQLFSGGPEGRRSYLDDLLEQTVGGFGILRRQYKRALTQRNTLLKSATSHIETQLFPWNIRLSQLGGSMARYRAMLVDEINVSLPPFYRELSQAPTQVAARYESKWSPENYESYFLKKLEADVEIDRVRGFTSSGPHREDLSILFNGRPASETASRGEVRTAVLALKIIELTRIAAARDTAPLLLLDDVFSELDGRRRHALTSHLAEYQTFITTTDADLVLQNFTEACNIIPLS